MNSPTRSKPWRTYEQRSPGDSPWPFRERIALQVWEWIWLLLCRWTPKPCNAWRIFWLRRFGARIPGRAFVHAAARIEAPWRVTLEEDACVGRLAVLYSLDEITLGREAIVAQEAYLCTGSHDFNDPNWPLKTAPIRIGEAAFVGIRALLLPGVTIGDGTVVGGGSVVTGDLPSWKIAAGNPCRPLRDRERIRGDKAIEGGGTDEP